MLILRMDSKDGNSEYFYLYHHFAIELSCLPMLTPFDMSGYWFAPRKSPFCRNTEIGNCITAI